MSEFYLEKYPVVSVNGEEYLVSVYPDRYAAYYVTCAIYKKGRGWFGREKFIALNDTGFNRPVYPEDNWNYDYIKIAMNEIEKYEKSIAATIEHKRKRKEAITKFEEWSGGVSDD